MTLPTTMRAVEITRPGGPEVLALTEQPVPQPMAGQILIEVAYAGVNRPDALQRAGAYAPPPSASPLPGLEAAGACGEWSVSDEVTVAGRGLREYVVTPAAMPVPNGLGLKSDAPAETFFTVDSVSSNAAA